MTARRLDVLLKADARPAIDALRRLSHQATFLTWLIANDPTTGTNVLNLREARP